jgi:hypothetical protein
VAVVTSGNDARRGAEDAASGLKELQDKYGDGEKGAGAENGNKWVYNAKDDAMRAQRHYFATETSANAVLFSDGIGVRRAWCWACAGSAPNRMTHIW